MSRFSELAPWPAAEHLNRVCKIKSGENLGTATVLDIEQKQYIVTALHVARQSVATSLIEVFAVNRWGTAACVTAGTDDDTDLAVLALETRITGKNLNIDISGKGCFAGQEVFFLGYPFGIHGHLVESGFHLPVVKRGVVALFEPTLPKRRLMLSGSANPGFSGGPVYYRDIESGKTVLHAILIESLGFETPVKDVEEKIIGKVTIDSGLIRCSYIDTAIDLIKANPIGLPVD